MRGKKIDSEFVGEFISKCVMMNINTTDEIVKTAKKDIEKIDEDIKRIEGLKIKRSKLLDVIITFDNTSKPIKVEEIKALSLFKIQNQHICKAICDKLKNKTFDITNIGSYILHPLTDVLFCVKQLIGHKVILRSGNYILRGENFDNYIKFVLKEI